MYSTDQEKADALNLFFCKNFNESISPITPLDSNYENDPCPNLLCTVEEVTSMLSSLDTTKASGPDGISGKMLKQTATAIAPSITALFNLSIKCNQPPKDWKYARVVPIPKQPRATTPGGFRPISLLSILSKLLEKHFHRLIVDHLTEHSPLSNVQWGFQKGKSTVSALLSTTDSWLKHLERGYEGLYFLI